MSDLTCVVPTCPYPPKTRGYCAGHYTRVYKHGDARADVPLRKKRATTHDRQPGQRFADCLPAVRGSGCWEWQGTRSHYGVMNDHGTTVYAHRFAWEQANGPMPEGKVVRHTCDNKFCVNPAHLLLGSQGENVQDAVERQLNCFGERHGRHRLTEQQVVEIKQHLREGKLNQRQIAELYPVVTLSAIEGIASGRTWKHVA